MYKIILNKKISVIYLHNVNDLLVLIPILLNNTKVTVIYGPHELETETDWLLHSRRQKSLYKNIEKHLIKYVDVVITVGPSIALWYKEKYNLKRKPYVVRNIPDENLQIDNANIDLRKKLNIPYDSLFFIYQGKLEAVRGVDKAVDVFKTLGKQYHILFLGYGRAENIVQAASVEYENIHFLPPVPNNELLSYTKQADVGIHLVQNICLNAYYCLPNKIFEYILAGIPVLASNCPDMAEIITKYKAGWLFTTNEEAINIINSMKKSEIEAVKENLKNVKHSLSWHNEEQEINEIYDIVLK